jgi:hypothetical protein
MNKTYNQLLLMNIIEDIEKFNIENVYFCDPIKNNIIVNGSFIRILYSNEQLVLNGIYLYVYFQNISIEKYFNKYKCIFDLQTHYKLIDKIRQIEDSILKKINIKNKKPSYKINDLLKNGNIKIFSENIDKINNGFLLKISGIWEDDDFYGVTYKFNQVSHS